MKIDNFPCPICGENDYHETGLHSEKTLVICKSCGSLWHSRDNTKEAAMLEYYRKDYRTAPDHKNLIYTQNKLMYIAKFVEYWLKDKAPGLICTDIGCATGYVPNWLRKMGHRATGTEYTVNFRRFAEHFYGIPVTEEIEKKHKYDFISCYHVLEHMMQPDKKLAEMRDCLADDGRILLSVPRFLHVYDDPSALTAPPFDHLYHKNHINLFTLQAIKNLIAKVGLEIEKENLVMYGMTFMLKKKNPEAPETALVIEDWQKHQAILENHHKAWNEFARGNFKGALDMCPTFAAAWTSFILQTIGKDPVRQQDTWKEALAVPELTDCNKVRMNYCFWLQNHERYEEAGEEWGKLYENKPNSDWLFQRAICLVFLRRFKEAAGLFHQVAAIQPLRWAECKDWEAKCAYSVPHWEERAVEEIKNELLKHHKDKIEIKPKDPVMNGAPK